VRWTGDIMAYHASECLVVKCEGGSSDVFVDTLGLLNVQWNDRYSHLHALHAFSTYKNHNTSRRSSVSQVDSAALFLQTIHHLPDPCPRTKSSVDITCTALQKSEVK
jgi:hypothetical protein